MDVWGSYIRLSVFPKIRWVQLGARVPEKELWVQETGRGTVLISPALSQCLSLNYSLSDEFQHP